ncbi:LigA [Strigomonas culicis]|uniref:LigA n=1 Tax=Strigomonas culicis TaxID=28005 RepID=S9UYD4_9TRYP|nr:LigA [Strigomonas culicis]|eukprot:EPY15540.1 LigA [Strigomonas culicis]
MLAVGRRRLRGGGGGDDVGLTPLPPLLQRDEGHDDALVRMLLPEGGRPVGESRRPRAQPVQPAERLQRQCHEAVGIRHVIDGRHALPRQQRRAGRRRGIPVVQLHRRACRPRVDENNTRVHIHHHDVAVVTNRVRRQHRSQCCGGGGLHGAGEHGQVTVGIQKGVRVGQHADVLFSEDVEGAAVVAAVQAVLRHRRVPRHGDRRPRVVALAERHRVRIVRHALHRRVCGERLRVRVVRGANQITLATLVVRRVGPHQGVGRAAAAAVRPVLARAVGAETRERRREAEVQEAGGTLTKIGRLTQLAHRGRRTRRVGPIAGPHHGEVLHRDAHEGQVGLDGARHHLRERLREGGDRRACRLARGGAEGHHGKRREERHHEHHDQQRQGHQRHLEAAAAVSEQEALLRAAEGTAVGRLLLRLAEHLRRRQLPRGERQARRVAAGAGAVAAAPRGAIDR